MSPEEVLELIDGELADGERLTAGERQYLLFLGENGDGMPRAQLVAWFGGSTASLVSMRANPAFKRLEGVIEERLAPESDGAVGWQRWMSDFIREYSATGNRLESIENTPGASWDRVEHALQHSDAFRRRYEALLRGDLIRAEDSLRKDASAGKSQSVGLLLKSLDPRFHPKAQMTVDGVVEHAHSHQHEVVTRELVAGQSKLLAEISSGVVEDVDFEEVGSG